MNPPKIEVFYQAENNYGFWWHLLDGYGKVRCWSGQGFQTDKEALDDAAGAVALMRDHRLTIVPMY